jgi:exosome complex RNA-binding protein Rrp4
VQAEAHSGRGTYVDGDSVLASLCGVVHRVSETESQVRSMFTIHDSVLTCFRSFRVP